MTIGIQRYVAFSSRPDGGNPAGVLLDADGLPEEDMLRIAAEVGYSETAFLTRRTDRRHGVRYFSPLAEVAFCGHATIAAAVALAESIGPGALTFDTRAGEIPVDVRPGADGDLWATLTSVPTFAEPLAPEQTARALELLGWSAADLDPAFPPSTAFGGNRHLMLAAAGRRRLADLDYDVDGLAALMREQDWTTANLFWAESPTRFHARNPFPVGGVVEDPATGAAAAAFGGLLHALGRVREPLRVRITQGEDLGRPSELLLDLTPGDRRSRVSGTATSIG
ncbi:PhzF family phenazine biosynthesis protein [Actinoalloteichus hoggarensis]|uniref:Putative isomerase YddE n=1 Tax=Actinoalloteichus hoggarensis TaxID=1470176 RepID=A0A221VZL9_9PSEU|nr:PhzF family phenazine biosynthesis isomerase [Actinoalloteichus hoggarensis]ASO18975.1 putative isomerase YddE [Actinoalloteichus hoggarensis]MBB5920211.1 PhzF family phenazine biosynthesis protein [Actinoalloteichus hoggarensis]